MWRLKLAPSGEAQFKTIQRGKLKRFVKFKARKLEFNYRWRTIKTKGDEKLYQGVAIVGRYI